MFIKNIIIQSVLSSLVFANHTWTFSDNDGHSNGIVNCNGCMDITNEHYGNCLTNISFDECKNISFKTAWTKRNNNGKPIDGSPAIIQIRNRCWNLDTDYYGINYIDNVNAEDCVNENVVIAHFNGCVAPWQCTNYTPVCDYDSGHCRGCNSDLECPFGYICLSNGGCKNSEAIQ